MSDKWGWKQFAATVTLSALVGSASTFALVRGLSRPADANANANVAAITAALQKVAANPQTGASVIPDIYKRVVPAVVSIDATISDGYSTGHATGSGFVVDPRGYILTNHHVIDGASKITVNFVDGTNTSAKVVGLDRTSDLAVLQVDTGTKRLTAVSLGDSDSVVVGELAIAIGSPYNNDFTVTAGIVSALNREIEEENNPLPIPGAIQTDAAINPGNSGGPLLNANGEVIGINTAIDSPVRGSVGLGFAIPINAAKRILPDLMAGKKIELGWMGLQLATLNESLAQRLGLDVTEGAFIWDVFQGGPGEEAGLQPAAISRAGRVISADVIVAVDSKTVKSADDVTKYVQTKRAGDTITLTVLRGRQRLTVPLTLQALPDSLY